MSQGVNFIANTVIPGGHMPWTVASIGRKKPQEKWKRRPSRLLPMTEEAEEVPSSGGLIFHHKRWRDWGF